MAVTNASSEHAVATPIGEDKPRAQRSVALDVVRIVAMASVFIVHMVELQFGPVRAFNPGPDWGTVRDRVAEWAPDGAGVLGAVTTVYRWIGLMGDQAVGVFIFVTGIALAMSAERRGTPLASAPDKRRWWRDHIWAIAVGWVLVHIGMAVLAWVSNRFTISPAQWQFWASLAGIRFLPQTYYYGLPAWWYVGMLIQFYLAFPLLLRALRRWGMRGLLVMGIGALVIRCIGLFTFHGIWLDIWSRGGFAITRLPELLLGMWIGLMLARSGIAPDTWLRTRIRPAMCLAAVVVWALGFAASFTLLGMTVAPLLTTAALGALLLAGGARLRESRFLRWGSTRAYDFYLVHHLPCLLLAVPATLLSASVLGRTALALVLSIIGAEVLYRVSRVILARRQRVLSRRGGLAIGATTAVLLAAITGAEAVSQQVDPREPLGWGERQSLTIDQRWGWKLKPNSTTHLRWTGYDYTVTANADGLPAVADTGSGRRVMVLGDAFSSAEGVDTPDSWVGQLSAASNNRVQVVSNASVTGWGPSQERRAAQDLIPREKPDVVVVETFVNDLLDVQLTDQEFQRSAGFRYPNPHTFPGLMAGANLRQLVPSRPELGIGGKPVDSTGYAFLDLMGKEPDPTLDQAAQTAQTDFAGIKAAADSVGATVIVVMVPSSAQVCRPSALPYMASDFNPADYDMDRPQRLLSQAWRNAGVTQIIDLRADLSSGECPYVPYNMHWSPQGHQRVAAIVARHVATG